MARLLKTSDRHRQAKQPRLGPTALRRLCPATTVPTVHEVVATDDKNDRCLSHWEELIKLDPSHLSRTYQIRVGRVGASSTEETGIAVGRTSSHRLPWTETRPYTRLPEV